MKQYLLATLVILLMGTSSAMAATDCTLMVDNATGKTLYRGGDCDTRQSPESTFKIALALIGYDSGILIDEHTPNWPFKEGYTVNKDNDRQATDPVLWEKNSVVWYSQKLTTQLGLDKFQSYVDRLNYGNRDLSGTPGQDGLTHAWLNTSLEISPVEQVAFICKLLSGGLDVSSRAMTMTQAILPSFKMADGWTVKGKTGSGYLPGPDGRSDKNHPQGWFVGWAQKGDTKIAFAKFISGDAPFKAYGGLKARDDFLAAFPQIIAKETSKP